MQGAGAVRFENDDWKRHGFEQVYRGVVRARCENQAPRPLEANRRRDCGPESENLFNVPDAARAEFLVRSVYHDHQQSSTSPPRRKKAAASKFVAVRGNVGGLSKHGPYRLAPKPGPQPPRPLLEATKLTFPNPIAFARSAARALGALARGNNILVPRSVVNFRWGRCRSCVQFDPVSEQCKVCSCFVELKVQLATEKCPLNRWGFVALTKHRLFRCLSKLWQNLQRAIRLAQSVRPI